MTWWDWLISDLYEYYAVVVAYFVLFLIFSYDEFVAKFSALTLTFGAGFNLLNFIAQAATNEPNLYIHSLFIAYKILAAGLIFRVWFKYNELQDNSKKYQEGKSYAVIKKPTTWKSLFIAIRYLPSDTIQLIHRGKWWKMNQTFRSFPVRSERLGGYWLIPLYPDIEFEQRFDKMVESKFNLFTNNCFHVFKKVFHT